MPGRSSALLLGLLAGLFIAGAAAALLWPAEKPRTVAARSDAPAARPVPPQRSAPVVRDVPRETARIAPPPETRRRAEAGTGRSARGSRDGASRGTRRQVASPAAGRGL